MSDETRSSRDTHECRRTLSRAGPAVTGKRVLLALGLWLLAAVVIGTATFFAARSSGAAAVTAIVVAEVYTLLIVALMIVFRPRTAQALGLVRCRGADVGLAFAACGGAYLIAAAIQSAVGPWPWSSSIAILKAMGSDDGRLATAGPAVAGIIVIRACVLAALARGDVISGRAVHVAPAAASGERGDPRLCRGTCRDPWLPCDSSPRVHSGARLRLGA